ncbi:MAG TPA: helix-turn-helix domain-containing protein [Pirellulales bacterium]|nr:helix-turn-helix domain-containing protein [Pirellulales bacterium]
MQSNSTADVGPAAVPIGPQVDQAAEILHAGRVLASVLVHVAAAADAEPAAPAAPDPRLDLITERLDRLVALMESLVDEMKGTREAAARIAPPREDRRLTLAEVAELLRKNYRTITRMRSAGKLPDSVKIGREHTYSADEIDAWLAAGTPDNAQWKGSNGV